MTDNETIPAAPKPWSRTDKALLGAIVVMTSLIVLGALAFVMSLFVRSGEPAAESAGVMTRPAPAPATSIDRIALDGNRLAVLSGGTVTIYDVDSGREVRRLSVVPRSDGDVTPR